MTDEPTEGRAAAWVTGLLAAGAAMGAAAIVNDANARRAEAQHPPAGTFVEVEGVRLHYREEGAGSPVVLLHGNGVTAEDYVASGVFAGAAIGHRVLAFDRPGSGYSTRPREVTWTPQAQARVIAAALERLGIGPAVIVGHSWGALVALALAAAHRERVSGLVLVGGFYYPTPRLDVLPTSLPGVPLLGTVMAHTVTPLAGALITPLIVRESFAPAPVSDKFAAFPLALAFRPSQIQATAADAALMVPSAAELAPAYPTLDLPVAILAGEGDRIVDTDEHARRLAAELPGASLTVLPGQGHMLHYAEPDAVTAAIDEVIARGLTR
jgi:pimeloyl-ACP methyl ester carboxylesterase